MDISRRVLFGAIAGGIVAAPIMAAFKASAAPKEALSTNREDLVERLMKPITWPDGEDQGLDDVRIGEYRGFKIRWKGWTGTVKDGEYKAKGGWLAFSSKDHIFDIAEVNGPWETDYYLDLLIKRRASLYRLLDRIEVLSQ